MSTNKEAVRAKQSQLLALTSTYCKTHVNDEYAELCSQLIGKMARKRDIPFLSGRIDIWAAAVVYAIGSINFLFDKNTVPYVQSDSICEHFNVTKSTVSQKSKRIRDMFQMGPFASEFLTEQRRRDNPFTRMVMVNGLIVALD